MQNYYELNNLNKTSERNKKAKTPPDISIMMHIIEQIVN